MSQSANFFDLFSLPCQFILDEDALTLRYRALQRQVHPDCYVNKTTMEKELALALASRLNEAYATLKKPLSRAVYLLSLQGINAFSETDTILPPEFLEQQMEWREALAESAGEEKKAVIADIFLCRDETATEAEQLLTAADWQASYDVIRRWRYLDKLIQEIR